MNKEKIKAWMVKDKEYGLCPLMWSVHKEKAERLKHDNFSYAKDKYTVVPVMIEITEITNEQRS